MYLGKQRVGSQVWVDRDQEEEWIDIFHVIVSEAVLHIWVTPEVQETSILQGTFRFGKEPATA